MPAAVDRCVKSLLKKWGSDPSSRPAPREKGQSAEDQAHAICTAAHKKSVAASLEIMLEGGKGPTFLGAAATNRPYIPHLKPTEVLERDGKKMLLVHLANSGHFNHPTGPFTLNRAVFSMFKSNHRANLIGQDAAYDCRHRPDDGAYGWFQELHLGDEIGKGEKEFWGLVDPTPVGLERIEAGEYRYSSMEFHRNFERDDVVLDLENTTEDFCLVDLEPETETPEEQMSDEKVTLEQFNTLQKQFDELKSRADAAEERAKEQEDRAKEQERLALEAGQRATALQKQAVDSEIAATVELAQRHRDEDGNALPRPLIDWVASFLKFEEIGEDDGVVQLEEGAEVPGSVQKYCIAAVKNLILSMPGIVPAERQTHSGDEDGSDEDEFEFESLWDEEE